MFSEKLGSYQKQDTLSHKHIHNAKNLLNI